MRIIRYIKKRNIESKGVSPSQLYVHGSTSPPNKSKTWYNYVAIHILVTATKRKKSSSFWSHSRCYVLLPETLLAVMQIRNHCYGKKAMCKNIIVIMTSQRQIMIFWFTSRTSIIKTPHCSTILDKINQHYWKWKIFQ